MLQLNYYWLVLFIIIIIVFILVYYFQGRHSNEDHRKKIAILYKNNKPVIPKQLDQIADVYFLKIKNSKEDLVNLIELEDIGVECYLSELLDEDVHYLQEIYFKEKPHILHLNQGSHIDIEQSNLIRLDSSDKYLIQAILKYSEGKKVSIVGSDDLRSKRLMEELNFPVYDENEGYDLVISLGPIVEKHSNVLYPFSSSSDDLMTIYEIGRNKHDIYDLAYMLSHRNSDLKVFEVVRNKEPLAHIIINGNEIYLLHHRFINQVDHILNSI